MKKIEKLNAIIQTILSQIYTWLNSDANKLSKFLIMGFFLIFFAIYIFIGSFFYNGDAGLIGVMTLNIQRLEYFNWYFNGQNYFGNLHPLVLSILTLPTGVSFEILSFWDLFFYYCSILLFLLTLKSVKAWQVIAIISILSFFVRYSEYLWLPLGFNFVTFIIAFFYWFFYNIYVDKIKLKYWTALITGLFTGLSFWHYPLYIIIAPIYALLVFIKNWGSSKRFNSILRFVGFSFIGFLAGLIPFILGGVSNNWENLEYYSSHSESSLSSYYYSLKYYFAQLFFFFIEMKPFVDYSGFQNILQEIFIDTERLIGLGAFFIIFTSFLLAVYDFRKKWLLLIFAGTILVMLIQRGASRDLSLYFQVRYSIPFLLIVIFFGLLNYLNQEKVGKLNITVFNKLGNLVLVGLFMISFTRGVSQTLNIYTDKQSYEIIYEDLTIKYNGKYLHCYNYFEFCGQLAFLGQQNNNLIVQTRDESGDLNGKRNIIHQNKVTEASKNGEKVYSLIKASNLREDFKGEILGVYKYRGISTEYVLVEGLIDDVSKQI